MIISWVGLPNPRRLQPSQVIFLHIYPVVLWRKELITAHQGMLLAAALGARIFALATGQDVASGIKWLEKFLSAE